MKKISLAGLFALFAATMLTNAQSPIATSDIYKAIKKTADWQLNELETKAWKYPATDWTNGAYYIGQMAWAKIANDERSLDFLKRTGEKNLWKGGPRRFFADDYCVGQTYAALYMLYHDPAMITPMKELGDDIIRQPHTASLDWTANKGIQNQEWAWCDALFMGPPTLACLYTATGEKKYLDIMHKLWWKTSDYLYDTTEHLYFRDSRYFDQKEKNGQKVFWSRGNGWVIAALTRILDNMPATYPGRQRYSRIFKSMARRIASLQQADGTWHASLLDPASYPSKETSGTAFFTYALTWGVNNGYLPYADYFPVIRKAWEALNACVHEDGKLGFVQVPGASPDKVTTDDTEVYGVGAYLLAGTELFKLMYGKEKEVLKVTVQNMTGMNRKEEMVELPWHRLAAATYTPDKTIVVNAQTGEEIASQVIYKGKKTPQAIIFQSGVTAGSTAYYYIRKQVPKTYMNRAYGRFVPERMDDFAWENDRIGFRMYGPSLQKTGEISNGIDVWAKRTSEMVIDQWYKDGDYHKDHGKGLDFYGVGTSLGAGGIAPYLDHQLYPSANYSSYKVLDKGPLRISFQLDYQPWKAANTKVSETKTITLDAGAYLNKIEVKYTAAKPVLTVATGIARLPGNGQQWSDVHTKNGLLAYEQPAQADGTIRIGVLVTQQSEAAAIPATTADHYGHTGHYILSTAIPQHKALLYFQGASWDKQGGFATFEAWKQYLLDKQMQLEHPLTISVYK